MFATKIKISKDMMKRIKDAVDAAGYSSVDELVENAIEKELDRISSYTYETAQEEEQIRAELRGLGYIN
jgi:Arc/MetJ-type ribon-helix-helix transcriptional regulator